MITEEFKGECIERAIQLLAMSTIDYSSSQKVMFIQNLSGMLEEVGATSLFGKSIHDAVLAEWLENTGGKAHSVVAHIIYCVFEDERFLEALNDLEGSSDPFGAASLVCADALQLGLPNSKLVRICSDLNGGQTEIYGVSMLGKIFDMGGCYASTNEWIKHFESLDDIVGRALHIDEGFDSSTAMERSDKLSKGIARLFVEHGKAVSAKNSAIKNSKQPTTKVA
jgi:hypothetical protein